MHNFKFKLISYIMSFFMVFSILKTNANAIENVSIANSGNINSIEDSYNIENLTTNQSDAVEVKTDMTAQVTTNAAVNINTNGEVTTNAAVVVDTQSPTVPTNLVASSITSTTITLSWTAAIDNVVVTGYDIYNGETKIGSTTGDTTYEVTGLIPNTSYSFTVVAKDAVGNISGSSSELSLTTSTNTEVTTSAAVTVDTQSPTVPTNLTVSSIKSTSCIVSWTASTDNVVVTGYDIYNGATKIGSTTGETTFEVTGLIPNTTYSFTIVAKDSVGNVSEVSSILNVKTLAPSITISSNLKLTEDSIYQDVAITSGTLDLNGHKLTVNGNLTQKNGDININGGQLSVTGDYNISNGDSYCYTHLKMTNSSDYVSVGGNFLMKSSYNHNGWLTAGVLEVKGNFTQKYNGSSSNFVANGSHKVILSANGVQTISFDNSDSCINMLEISNSNGVVFNTPVVIKTLTGNNKINSSLNLINTGTTTLTGDCNINGDLTIPSGTLDLNGHRLILNGSLTQTGGTLFVNGGQLSIAGDYNISNGDNSCKSYLEMIKSSDYISVGGNFLMKSSYNHNGWLTAGVLEVKGNFIQKYNGSSSNFVANGSHKVILSGDRVQTISFDNSDSCFNMLEISNSNSVVFNTPVGIKTLAGTNKINSSINLTITGTTKLASDYSTNGDLTIAGGTLDLNGHRLILNGNLTQTGGTLFVNGGQLSIAGDYNISNGANSCNSHLQMIKSSDYISVGGNFLMKSSYNHNGGLTAGVLEVKGNFTQKCNGSSSNFEANGSHKVILSGDGVQTISFDNTDSRFNMLEISNSNGVVFNTPVGIKTLTGNNKINSSLNLIISGPTTLTGDCNINGDFTVQNGNLDLCGRTISITGNLVLPSGNINLDGGKLNVNGNLTQIEGTLFVNGGQLSIAGDYNISNGDNSCKSYLEMIKSSDYISVGGNFLMKSSYNHNGWLTEGILEVKGNFIQKYNGSSSNFVANGSHKVILNGNRVQTISFDDPSDSHFNNLKLTKQLSTGYSYNTLPVIGKIELPEESTVTLNNTNLNLEKGNTSTLTATVSPSNKSVTWSSSNTAVVTVDSNGKVTAVEVGAATITCTISDGSGTSATCNVIITEAVINPIDGLVNIQDYLTNLNFNSGWGVIYSIGNNTLKIQCNIVNPITGTTYEYVEVYLPMQEYAGSYYAKKSDIIIALGNYFKEKTNRGIYARQWSADELGIFYDVNGMSQYNVFGGKNGPIDITTFINQMGPQWEMNYMAKTNEDRLNDMQKAIDICSAIPVIFIPAQGTNILISFARGNTKDALIRTGELATVVVVGKIISVVVKGGMETKIANCGDDTKLMESTFEAAAETVNQNTTKIYRVMSEGEYESLMSNDGKFVQYDMAMESKWFATNIEDATEWGKKFYPDGNYKMVEIEVPIDSLKDMYYVEKLDGIGPAYCAEFDFINSVIKSVKEVLVG